jgi:SAM-dependent methyltransferase
MLAIAQRLNPEVDYHHGDMRDIRLGRRFDVVAVPDAVGYMTTIDDLGRAVGTARRHLKPDGILLIVALLREDFRENNFVYAGSREDVSVTLFENNATIGPTTYEATFVYLVRRPDRLETYIDRHTLGIFDAAAWRGVFQANMLRAKTIDADDTYERYLAKDGVYRQVVYVCERETDPA